MKTDPERCELFALFEVGGRYRKGFLEAMEQWTSKDEALKSLSWERFFNTPMFRMLSEKENYSPEEIGAICCGYNDDIEALEKLADK